MGSRSITEIIAPGFDRCRSYLHWGSPEFQIARIGEWIFDMARAGAALSPTTWMAWAAVRNGEGRGVVAGEPMQELPGDLEHHYIITIDLAQPPRLQYLHRDVRDPQRRWVCLGDFRGGLAILAAGVDMLERLRRQSARLEGERGRAQFPSAGIADWRDAHGAKIVVARDIYAAEAVLPDHDVLPMPMPGQTITDYLEARADCATEYCGNVLTQVEVYRSRGDTDTAAYLAVRVRGLLREAHRARAGLEFGPALAGFGEHAAICEDMAKLGPLAHLLTSPTHDLLDGFDGADSPGIVTALAAISEPAVPEPFNLDIGAGGAGFGL